jgi:ribulose-phosphate 3-epimerase
VQFPSQDNFARKWEKQTDAFISKETKFMKIAELRRSKKRPLLSASLLAANFAILRDELAEVQQGGIDCLHIDVMDGHFVPNLGIAPFLVKSIRQLVKLPISCHLMVDEPERWISPFVDAGADNIIVHVESTKHIHRVLQSIKSKGCEAGVSLNPGTPLVAIEEVLNLVDSVLVMSVDPGFGGQAFVESTISKVERVKLLRGQNDFLIAVDGGIEPRFMEALRQSGTDIYVVGTGIFSHGNRGAAIAEITSHLAPDSP